jgi:hypothetical protein
MKKAILLTVTALLGMIATAASGAPNVFGIPSRGGRGKSTVFGMTSRGALGVRFQPMHSYIETWPYDGDLAYGLAYALYDGMGYLEVGLDYTPEATADSVIDDVLTPRLNLGLKDGIFVAGIGLADGYVSKATGGSEWTGLIYQFQLGVDVPFGQNFEVGASAYYSFDDVGELGDFEFDELEYGIHVGYFF